MKRKRKNDEEKEERSGNEIDANIFWRGLLRHTVQVYSIHFERNTGQAYIHCILHNAYIIQYIHLSCVANKMNVRYHWLKYNNYIILSQQDMSWLSWYAKVIYRQQKLNFALDNS